MRMIASRRRWLLVTNRSAATNGARTATPRQITKYTVPQFVIMMPYLNMAEQDLRRYGESAELHSKPSLALFSRLLSMLGNEILLLIRIAYTENSVSTTPVATNPSLRPVFQSPD